MKQGLTQTAAQKLREIYLEKQSRNQAYSLRAFARDLQVSHTLLSLVMNGKRPLSFKQAAQFSIALNLSQEEQASLMALVSEATEESTKNKTPKKTPEFWNFEIEQFKTIAQWHHLALLDLVLTKDFQEDTKWIAKRLGISPLEARDALERLERVGLVVRKDGKLSKKRKWISFQSPTPKAAIRQYHAGSLLKAIDELKNKTSQYDLDHRWIGGGTMCIQKDKIKKAREKLKKFQDAFIQEFGDDGSDNGDEVFQVGFQFFPLTQLDLNSTIDSINQGEPHEEQ